MAHTIKLVTCVFGLDKPATTVYQIVATFKSLQKKNEKKKHFSFFLHYSCCSIVLCSSFVLKKNCFSLVFTCFIQYLWGRRLVCVLSWGDRHTRAHFPCKCVILFRISWPNDTAEIMKGLRDNRFMLWAFLYVPSRFFLFFFSRALNFTVRFRFDYSDNFCALSCVRVKQAKQIGLVLLLLLWQQLSHRRRRRGRLSSL